MTTEQMDWLDDERAGRHAPKVLRGHPTEQEIAEARKDAPFGVLIVPTEELGPYFGERLNPDEPAPDLDPEQHFGNEPDFYEQMERSRRDVAAFMGVPVEAIQITLNHDVAEDHTHHTREARDQCAAGDHKYAELLDLAAEREKRAADDWEIRSETTMAEEPREHAERRQWLDGYLAGFREGFERAGR